MTEVTNILQNNSRDFCSTGNRRPSTSAMYARSGLQMHLVFAKNTKEVQSIKRDYPKVYLTFSALHISHRLDRIELSQLRRMAEKEAHEARRASQIMHDVESKAFAAYAKDLKHQDELLPRQSERPSKSQPVKDQLHKVLYFVSAIVASIIEGKEKDTSRNRQTPAVRHRWLLYAPCRQDRWSAEKRKGGMFQQTQSTTDHILTAYWILSQTKKVRVNEDEEAKAKRLRKEAQERVKQRSMQSFGLR